jgi:L-ascorbate metabolism protein UlaG (beta-lactamase superfamily)
MPNFGFTAIRETSYRVKITWLGHAGFMIESNNNRIYINPYLAAIGSLKGDGIIVSNSGPDLCDQISVSNLAKDDAIIIMPPECAARMNLLSIQQLIVGTNYTINNFLIETVHAYHLNGTISRGDGAGLIITVNGTRIYYAGITDYIPELSLINDIDVAIIPIAGSDLSLNLTEAITFLKTLKATYNIPMYYGGNTGTTLDVGREFKSMAALQEVNVTLLSNQDLLLD